MNLYHRFLFLGLLFLAHPIYATAFPHLYSDTSKVIRKWRVSQPKTEVPPPARVREVFTASSRTSEAITPEVLPTNSPPSIRPTPNLAYTAALAENKPAALAVPSASNAAFRPRTMALAYSLQAFNQKPLQIPLRAPRIEINKSQRNLIVFDGETEVRRFGIGLGLNPQGAKEVQGDGKTPEGIYKIVTKSTESKFYKNLGINYPNQEDADRALEKGRITKTQYWRITVAHDLNKLPPSNTKLGGQIFIHGQGRFSGDWTEGCISLRDEDLDELYRIIPIGTPLQIYW